MNETRYCPHCKRSYSVYAPLATMWDHQAGRCIPPVDDSLSKEKEKQCQHKGN
jgi:hypothetical protein